MNFEVGDVAINIGALAHWNNPFHWQLTINMMEKKVVHVANAKVFSFYDVELYPDHNDTYYRNHPHAKHIIMQSSGLTYDEALSTRWANLTKNREQIEARFRELYDAAEAKANQEDARVRGNALAEIARLQKIIEVCDNRMRPLGYKTEIIEHQFNDERLAHLMSILDS